MGGMQLPDGLADFLNMLGYTWPKADEARMFDLGGKWLDFGGKLQEIHSGGAVRHGDRVKSENMGADIEAFAKKFADPNGGPSVVKDGGTGSMVIGGALFVAAGIVLALKILVIVQLGILAAQIAAALAAAVPTFGASMAWIPVAKKVADVAISMAIDQVLNQILS